MLHRYISPPESPVKLELFTKAFVYFIGVGRKIVRNSEGGVFLGEGEGSGQQNGRCSPEGGGTLPEYLLCVRDFAWVISELP